MVMERKLGNNHIHTFKHQDTILKMNYFDLETECKW